RLVDFTRLCEDVLDELRLAHPERELQLSAGGETYGYWDGDRLTRLIQNLVGNAITHGRPGTAVNVVVSADDETLTLEVINQGEPIPAWLREHLFAPFRRGSKLGQGLGLGLYIARSVVLAHGGKIGFESDDVETRFHVRLPRTVR